MDGSNDVYVMFRNALGGNRDMYVARSRDGGKTFGAAAKVGSSPQGSALSTTTRCILIWGSHPRKDRWSIILRAAMPLPTTACIGARDGATRAVREASR